MDKMGEHISAIKVLLAEMGEWDLERNEPIEKDEGNWKDFTTKSKKEFDREFYIYKIRPVRIL